MNKLLKVGLLDTVVEAMQNEEPGDGEDHGQVWGDCEPGDGGGSEREGNYQGRDPEGSEGESPADGRPVLQGEVILRPLQAIWETEEGDRRLLHEWRVAEEVRWGFYIDRVKEEGQALKARGGEASAGKRGDGPGLDPGLDGRPAAAGGPEEGADASLLAGEGGWAGG